MLYFEYDKNKDEKNLLRHGIRLEAAKMLWDDCNLIMGPATSIVEERWAAIGKIGNICWLAIFTFRGEKIRLISCRRARQEEIIVYEHSK